MKLLLKGGRVIDPSQDLDQQVDLHVAAGKVAAIGAELPAPAEDGGDAVAVIDVSGRLVVPGLVDMHTHLREPGQEYKETIASGSAAAAAAGFTTVACMPNTDPVNDNRAVTEFILAQARAAGLVNVLPVAAITKGLRGKELAEYADLKDAGAVAISDDGWAVMDSGVMRRALEYAHSLGLPVICHSEDTNLSRGGAMHEGLVSLRLGLRGIPSIAEDIMVARDLALAEYTRTAVHIAHVSTAGAVALIRAAKERGVQVTAEAAPHHFILTDAAVEGFDTNAKVSPPLRSEEHLVAVRQGLQDGTIDAIASDHAPHSSLEKEVEFDYAANGMIGLETSLPLSLELVRAGVLSMVELVRKMSTNPAKILGVPKGSLRPGCDADVTVIDPSLEWTVDVADFRSKSKNSPFHGRQVKGRAVLTIVGGEIKYRHPSVE